MSLNIVVLQNIAIVTAKSQSLSYQIKIQPKHKKSRGNNAGQKKLCLVFAAILLCSVAIAISISHGPRSVSRIHIKA